MLSQRIQWVGTSMVFALLTACGPGGADKASHGPEAPTVQTMSVTLGSAPNTVELSGRARAFAEAEIRPQVSGIIQARLFTEGEVVKQGQALYQIDPAEYASAVQSAKATLTRATAAAGSARETAKRYERLAAINAVSQQEYEQASATAQQAEADIALQRAQLNRAQIDLSRTRIVSPIAGNIGRSQVTQGALVTQNQATALASVVQLDPINIDLSASAVRIMIIRDQIASGQIATADGSIPVTIKFENGTTYKYEGQLEFSEVIVDETSGTVAVRVEVPNPDGVLLPGMFLHASLSAGRFENVVELPQGLVGRTPKGEATVLVVNNESKIEQRIVMIAGQSENSWIIRSGLAAGDKVVVSNLQAVRAGMTVQAIPATSKADSTLAKADSNAELQ
jgi:membrane fusion protein, multidrug efflux system